MNEPEVASPTARAAQLYLVLFPLGHLVFLPVAGAMAAAGDVLLLVLLTAWALDLLARAEAWEGIRASVSGQVVAGVPGRRFMLGMLLLLGFAAWVGASGWWGFHPRYAVAKAVGLGALGLGALALAASGIGWRRAADAWLVGTGLAVAVTLAVGLAGPDALGARVIHGGSGVQGLPFPRVSGPFLHPNMFGDYLVVSALLLWGRWPDYRGRARLAALALAAASALFLALTASTALVGGGVAAAWLGRRWAADGVRGAGTALRVAGLAVAVTTAVLVLVPLDFGVAGLELATGGIRPAIWGGALRAVVESPLLGVGAAPYVAEARDPLLGGALGLYDAHNAVLSVLGQFGAVGAALAGAGAWLVVSGALGAGQGDEAAGGAAPHGRARAALGFAVLAVTVNSLLLASEDLRHVWALLGVLGAASAGPGPAPLPQQDAAP